MAVQYSQQCRLLFMTITIFINKDQVMSESYTIKNLKASHRKNTPTKKIRENPYYLGQLPSNSDEHSDYQFRTNIINSQKTQRLRARPYVISCEMSPIIDSEKSVEFEEQLSDDLTQLTHQINLHKDAIEKANNLIQILTEENTRLAQKLSENQRQVQQIKQEYQKKLQKANSAIQELELKISRAQTTAASFALQKKASRMTPVKIYSKNQQSVRLQVGESQASILKQIGKIILIESMNKLSRQLSSLEELSKQQNEQMQKIVQHNKYVQAYIEDQVVSSKLTENTAKFGGLTTQNQEVQPSRDSEEFQLKRQQKIRQLINFYNKQILGWQKYANNLKFQLTQCIKFIESLSLSSQQRKKEKRAYTNEDLVNFITKQICKVFSKKNAKKDHQIKELRQILKDLFAQIKKNQWKFINRNQVILP